MSVITAAFTQFFPFSAWEWTVEAQCGCCFSKLHGIACHFFLTSVKILTFTVYAFFFLNLLLFSAIPIYGW